MQGFTGFRVNDVGPWAFQKLGPFGESAESCLYGVEDTELLINLHRLYCMGSGRGV